MVTYAVLAAQRLPLRDFAWNNNSVQTVSRSNESGVERAIPCRLGGTGTLACARYRGAHKERSRGTLSQAMQNEHLRKKGRVGSNSPGAHQNHVSPQLPRNHILARNAQATA